MKSRFAIKKTLRKIVLLFLLSLKFVKDNINGTIIKGESWVTLSKASALLVEYVIENINIKKYEHKAINFKTLDFLKFMALCFMPFIKVKTQNPIKAIDEKLNFSKGYIPKRHKNTNCIL